MSVKRFSMIAALGGLLAMPSPLTVAPAKADDTGAFIGGVMAARIGQNMRARTQAQQQQAYYAQQQAQQQAQPVPQAAAQPTTEQKLAQLDKLAAGGYITPEEYKARRQQILDSM